MPISFRIIIFEQTLDHAKHKGPIFKICEF